MTSNNIHAKTKPILNGIPKTFTKKSSICPPICNALITTPICTIPKITKPIKKAIQKPKNVGLNFLK